jgi:hypothetical protein
VMRRHRGGCCASDGHSGLPPLRVFPFQSMRNDNVVPLACPGRTAAVVRCGPGTVAF